MCYLVHGARFDNIEGAVGLSMILPSIMAQNTISYYVTHVYLVLLRSWRAITLRARIGRTPSNIGSTCASTT